MNRLRADVSFAIISYSYLLLLSLFLSLSLINHTKHAAVTALYESAQQLISVRKITIIIDVISFDLLDTPCRCQWSIDHKSLSSVLC